MFAVLLYLIDWILSDHRWEKEWKMLMEGVIHPLIPYRMTTRQVMVVDVCNCQTFSLAKYWSISEQKYHSLISNCRKRTKEKKERTQASKKTCLRVSREEQLSHSVHPIIISKISLSRSVTWPLCLSSVWMMQSCTHTICFNDDWSSSSSLYLFVDSGWPQKKRIYIYIYDHDHQRSLNLSGHSKSNQHN